jgi:hypothetical protein
VQVYSARVLYAKKPAYPEGKTLMSRYKGQNPAQAVERKFPHIVEMAVPPNGFGKRLDAMYEWHGA